MRAPLWLTLAAGRRRPIDLSMSKTAAACKTQQDNMLGSWTWLMQYAVLKRSSQKQKSSEVHVHTVSQRRPKRNQVLEVKMEYVDDDDNDDEIRLSCSSCRSTLACYLPSIHREQIRDNCRSMLHSNNGKTGERSPVSIVHFKSAALPHDSDPILVDTASSRVFWK